MLELLVYPTTATLQLTFIITLLGGSDFSEAELAVRDLFMSLSVRSIRCCCSRWYCFSYAATCNAANDINYNWREAFRNSD